MENSLKRSSPKVITQLAPEDVFVFGSNEAGRHLAGAAFQALNWGAEFGKHYGLAGQTFAIPTLDKNLNKLSIESIGVYVMWFTQFAEENENLNFMVTEIGCGIAGFTHEQIAPLFKWAVKLQNIYLPVRFIDIIEQNG